MRQICEGVAFIHSHNIIHLDLKPENILCLTKTGNRIKIIDFGLARKFEPDKKLQVLFGTPEFVAPEVVNFDQISCATDMWSVGVICYVLLSGLSPFMGETDVETMANVTIARYDFEDESFDDISTEAKDFISRLLVKDKEARLTAVECLSHPWLRRQIPPPPPALDTTKDNLRNYVEKCVPLIHNPIIIDKEFHDKPGLIEKIIENEQKVIHPRSLTSNERNEIPILPTLNEHRPDPIFHNPNKSRFKIDNHPCINEKESVPNILENKGFQKAEVIDENNKNIARLNKIPINQQPNEIIFDNLAKARDMNNSNSQNVMKITGMVPLMESINNDKSIDVKAVPALSNITSFNESPIDKNDNSLQVSKIVPIIENNLTQLQGKTIDNKTTEQKINKLPLENNPHEKGNVDPTITEMKQYPPKTSKIFAEKLPVIEEKEVKGESPQFQMKRPATNMHLIGNKPKIVEPIAVPSISTVQITNDSSNFSLHNFKYDNPFNKKPEKSIISDYIKNTENKNVSSERITPSLAFNESLMKEVAPLKENPLVFKQHLRSTPPWFSELKNEDSRKTTSTTSTRFDRRSSDFSCFLNSKEDTESLNLADEIRKLSARLIQMSGNQPNPQNQPLGGYNANSVPPRSRNDPITCFLENHGITHPRPKFKFSSLNRDVPIGSPPPPSNLAYYLNMASKTERKDSHSAPQSPRSSPEKNCGTENNNASYSSITSDIHIKKGKSQHISQEKTSSSIILDHVQINKTNKKLNFPV